MSVTVKDVPAEKFVVAFAEYLKRTGKVGLAMRKGTHVLAHAPYFFPCVCAWGTWLSTPLSTALVLRDSIFCPWVPGLASCSLPRVLRAFLPRTGAPTNTSVQVQVPKWVDVVKTGTHKELGPYNPDWYFIRMGEWPPRGTGLMLLLWLMLFHHMQPPLLATSTSTRVLVWVL